MLLVTRFRELEIKEIVFGLILVHFQRLQKCGYYLELAHFAQVKTKLFQNQANSQMLH